MKEEVERETKTPDNNLSFVCSLTPALDQLSCNHFNFLTCQLGPSRNLCCRAVLLMDLASCCVSTVPASCCVRAYGVCCFCIIELPLVHCCSIIDAKLLMDASFVYECACVHYHSFICERVFYCEIHMSRTESFE